MKKLVTCCLTLFFLAPVLGAEHFKGANALHCKNHRHGAMQCVLPSRFVDVRYKHATELTNNLHNHPLADMIKNFWKEIRKVKDSAGTKKAHAVESSPEGPGTRRRCSPASSSDKSAQTKATKSAKVRVRSAVRKTPQTKRESRVVLSPLEIIKNPPLYPSKRRSEMLDSPTSSKLSVVTPNNLSRSFKRQKSCSMPSSQQYRNGKR